MIIREVKLTLWFLLSGFFVFNVSASVLYVDLNSTNPAPPYTNWMTAATNIQDAIDAASTGDFIVVSNGTYSTGGRAVYGNINRVAVDKAITVESLNGPGLNYSSPVAVLLVAFAVRISPMVRH